MKEALIGKVTFGQNPEKGTILASTCRGGAFQIRGTEGGKSLELGRNLMSFRGKQGSSVATEKNKEGGEL